MPKYAALLRGINVGGHQKVAMADLRELLSGLGYSGVRTHLQSGNAIFTSRSGNPAKLALICPSSAILLRAFDLLVIDDFATDTLTAAQRIHCWVLMNPEYPTLTVIDKGLSTAWAAGAAASQITPGRHQGIGRADHANVGASHLFL